MPARNMPMTTIGASMRSAATSGWVFHQSTTRSRFRSATVSIPGNAASPSSLKRASRVAESTSASRPSRKSVGTEVVEARARTGRSDDLVDVDVHEDPLLPGTTATRPVPVTGGY